MAVNRDLVQNRQSGVRYREKTLMPPRKPQKFLLLCNLIMAVLHAMSDAVVFTSNRQPSEGLFLPIREPSKIGSFLTSFTGHGCLMFQRKRETEWDHMLLPDRNIQSLCHALFLPQSLCGWFIIWCMTRIFLHFKAYSAYLCDHLPERASRVTPDDLSVGKAQIHPHMLGIKREWTCHSGRYVTDRTWFFGSVPNFNTTRTSILERVCKCVYSCCILINVTLNWTKTKRRKMRDGLAKCIFVYVCLEDHCLSSFWFPACSWCPW